MTVVAVFLLSTFLLEFSFFRITAVAFYFIFDAKLNLEGDLIACVLRIASKNWVCDSLLKDGGKRGLFLPTTDLV